MVSSERKILVRTLLDYIFDEAGKCKVCIEASGGRPFCCFLKPEWIEKLKSLYPEKESIDYFEYLGEYKRCCFHRDYGCGIGVPDVCKAFACPELREEISKKGLLDEYNILKGSLLYEKDFEGIWTE